MGLLSQAFLDSVLGELTEQVGDDQLGLGTALLPGTGAEIDHGPLKDNANFGVAKPLIFDKEIKEISQDCAAGDGSSSRGNLHIDRGHG